MTGTKPVVTITYDEIYALHEILNEHLPALVLFYISVSVWECACACLRVRACDLNEAIGDHHL